MSLHESDLCYMSISASRSVSLCVALKKEKKTQGRARLALGRISDKLKRVRFLLEETLTDQQNRVRYLQTVLSVYFKLLRTHDG